MDNIVDLTFDFETYEKFAVNSIKEFNKSMDSLLTLKVLWDASKKER